MSNVLLPIFPLHTVLFPGTLIRLKVGETRYRSLIEAALSEHHRRFGVALVRPETESAKTVELYTVGTVAQILQCTRQGSEDINLIAVGRERFRIVSFDRSGTYPIALVQESPLRSVASPRVHVLERKARSIATEYFGLLLDLTRENSSQFQLPKATVPLANFIGANIQISTDRRQQLLEFNELETLLGEEVDLLERELKRIQWFETQKRLRPRGPARFSLN